jgi:hypothetical protein
MDLVQAIYEEIDEYVDKSWGNGKESSLDAPLKKMVLDMTDAYSDLKDERNDDPWKQDLQFLTSLEKRVIAVDKNKESNVGWFVQTLARKYANNAISEMMGKMEEDNIRKDKDFERYIDPLSEHDRVITLEEIKEDIINSDNPSLSEKEGHVTQLWNDGEITSQKSGGLLWQRTLHLIKSGLKGVSIKMPHESGGNSYIFCAGEDAERIRNKMLEYKKQKDI